MIRLVVLSVACVLMVSWSVGIFVATRCLVGGFGDTLPDNRRIITMEWIGEGVALISIAAFVAAATILDATSVVALGVYLVAMAGLIVLAVVALLTTFRIAFLPHRLLTRWTLGTYREHRPGGGAHVKRIVLFAVIVLSVALLAGCAPAANPTAGQGGDVAGFWQGLWQGFIILFTFIISLFNHSVGIYEVHNNGGWYNFGYLLGVMLFWGGGGGGAAGSRRR